MSYEHPDTLVIVFGAGGRLGQALLPLLADGPWVVVAVARTQKPLNPPPSVHWIQVDVTEVGLWERSLRVLGGMAEAHERVIVVDLLLDKTSVRAMRLSLAAGTAYITRLCSRLAVTGCPNSLVVASTTAVLALWPYQTPYCLAKRRQLGRYASAGLVGRALLLPQLVDGESDPAAGGTPRAWTFADASARVHQAAIDMRANAPSVLCVHTPQAKRSPDQPAPTCHPGWLSTIAQATAWHLASWTNAVKFGCWDRPVGVRLGRDGG